jgi:DNA-binding transcriptional LysR family regulator
MDWGDLRYLLALRRAGSLAAAARELKVDQSTVSRRLAALEDALGAQLVARTPDGMSLTEAGALAAETAAGIGAACDELGRRIGGSDARPEGVVRVSTTESMAAYLFPRLGTVRDAHPGITLEVVASNAALDLARREADLAVRMFRETRPGLIARKLGEIGWSVYAAPSYLARRGAAGVGDLRGHDLVGYDQSLSGTAGARWLAEHGAGAQVVFRGNSPRAVAAAVAAGLGISALPCFVTAADPNLRRLTPEIVGSSEVFAVIPPDHKGTTRVKIVSDCLAALFQDDRALLRGDP